ncbi:MAG: membrane protein insertion efficiency factor YidD [Candidatus Neomarinimicrobiota bacterium]
MRRISHGPSRNLSTRKLVSLTALGLIRLYTLLVSPFFPPACRFRPTCSEYAAEAFKKHSLSDAGRLTIKRILRCHPWSRGGLDPVP